MTVPGVYSEEQVKAKPQRMAIFELGWQKYAVPAEEAAAALNMLMGMRKVASNGYPVVWTFDKDQAPVVDTLTFALVSDPEPPPPPEPKPAPLAIGHEPPKLPAPEEF